MAADVAPVTTDVVIAKCKTKSTNTESSIGQNLLNNSQTIKVSRENRKSDQTMADRQSNVECESVCTQRS